MNATPHRLLARRAALSPFDIQITSRTARPSAPAGSGHYGEFWPDGNRPDVGYGCVEWYQYPGAQADAIRTAD
jgi:hypothetical protein